MSKKAISADPIAEGKEILACFDKAELAKFDADLVEKLMAKQPTDLAPSIVDVALRNSTATFATADAEEIDNATDIVPTDIKSAIASATLNGGTIPVDKMIPIFSFPNGNAILCNTKELGGHRSCIQLMFAYNNGETSELIRVSNDIVFQSHGYYMHLSNKTEPTSEDKRLFRKSCDALSSIVSDFITPETYISMPNLHLAITASYPLLPKDLSDVVNPADEYARLISILEDRFKKDPSCNYMVRNGFYAATPDHFSQIAAEMGYEGKMAEKELLQLLAQSGFIWKQPSMRGFQSTVKYVGEKCYCFRMLAERQAKLTATPDPIAE